MTPRLLTTSEVAAMLAVSRQHVRALVRAKRLRGVRVGCSRRSGPWRVYADPVWKIVPVTTLAETGTYNSERQDSNLRPPGPKLHGRKHVSGYIAIGYVALADSKQGIRGSGIRRWKRVCARRLQTNRGRVIGIRRKRVHTSYIRLVW